MGDAVRRDDAADLIPDRWAWKAVRAHLRHNTPRVAHRVYLRSDLSIAPTSVSDRIALKLFAEVYPP